MKQTQKHTRNHVVGKWVFKQTKAPILTCVCGNKYIKTRPRQTVCIRCLNSKQA